MKYRVLLFMLLLLAGHAYIFLRVWQILPVAWWGKLLVILLMLSMLGCMFLTMSRRDSFSLEQATVFYEFGTSWIFIALYLLMLFLGLDILRMLHLIPANFMHHSFKGTLVVLGIMVTVFVYGNIHYNKKYRQTLQLTTEKSLQRPLKVLMMSDLHLGYHNRKAEFHRWVDMLNAEDADLILIAGDIIDFSTVPLLKEGVASEFHRLNAPVIACLGNHDGYAGDANSQQFFEEAGITLLRDEFIEWKDLCIIGRDDRTNPKRFPLQQIMQGIDRSKYLILMDHQPFNLEQAEQCGVDFQLSGHTHYGQVWPISWITRAIYECTYGEYQLGATRYYVSSGMGIWGGKFRIGTRSEYLVAEISGE